ncbi:EF-hand domain-containing protein [Nocardiopsis sp. LOL_012]|uniref:EF-hand domain-containing protein n=1 Tax=Nocardiopsis sp. LOL_012 TaxID=3345409 RepID=UPI003A8801B4
MTAYSAHRERRLDHAFFHLDVDRNGYAEHDDLTALAARLMDLFGEAPGTAKGGALIDGFETFWQALLAAIDLDGDRRISPREWREGMVGAFAEREGGFDRCFRPAVVGALAMVDTDEDGSVSPDEWRRFQRAFGTSPEDAELSFARLDSDGDGTLSVDELVENARQFYTGTDESAVGNWFFGRVD